MMMLRSAVRTGNKLRTQPDGSRGLLRLVSADQQSIQRKPDTCACGGGCPRCQSIPLIQAKLAVSRPGDPYELEADRMADRIMRMPAPAVRRQSASCASGGTACPKCEAEAQRRVSRKAQEAIDSDAPPSVESVIHSPGAPLSASTRAFFEPRFGEDLGHVRVHTDGMASRSAREVNALAYTVGSHVVFGAGRYAPGTPAGRWLLAHELTHVLQQGRKTGVEAVETRSAPVGRTVLSGLSNTDLHPSLPGLQRTADPDLSGPCDQYHVDDLIEPAFVEAGRWRRAASAWLESHLDHIQARGRIARSGFVKVGRTVFDELMLLERHFRISSVLRIRLPYSADDTVSVDDLERLGNASYWVRRRFRDVDLSLSYLCQVNCPRGRTGSDTLGSAVAGSREVTFYTNCFDRQHETTRAGVALHEAFHASFSEFDHDTYSFEGGYPGSNALTNAESFATFAAFVATGANYRIIVIPDITVRGGS